MRRLIALVLAASVILPSCRAEERPVEKLRRILTRMGEGTIQYVYGEDTKDGKVEVRARLEDTLRHQETLIVGGQKVLEQVTHDDALAVQVSKPDLVPQLKAVSDPQDQPAATALSGGQWVVDPAGAPGINPASADRTSISQVGEDPVRDASNIFQYLNQAIQQAAVVVLFNADAIDYRPREDPFPQPNKKIGERRYDLVRPPLPQREGTTLPTTANFRKMSFYVVRDRIVRVREEINISRHEDIVRAKQTGRNKFLLKLESQLRAGAGQERVRERTMSFEVLSAGEQVTIEIPGQGFVGNLRAIFQRKATGPGGQPQQPNLPPGIPAGQGS